MPRAVKGQRFGGRVKGTPNHATVEKALKAQRELEAAKASGKKLAKEVLEDFMHLFAGIATTHQPFPPSRQQNPHYNEDLFEKYAKLTVDTAAQAAKYQSPQYRAIMVSPAPQSEVHHRKRFTLTIFEAPPRALMPPRPPEDSDPDDGKTIDG